MENTEAINVTEAELAEVYTARPLTDRLRYRVQTITEQASVKQVQRHKTGQTRRKFFALAGVAAGVGIGLLSYPTIAVAYTLQQIRHTLEGANMIHIAETKFFTNGTSSKGLEFWYAPGKELYRSQDREKYFVVQGKKLYEWETNGDVIRQRTAPLGPPNFDFSLASYMKVLKVPLNRFEVHGNEKWNGQEANIISGMSSTGEKIVFCNNPKTNHLFFIEIHQKDGQFTRAEFDYSLSVDEKIFSVEAIGKPIIDAEQEQKLIKEKLIKGIASFPKQPSTVIRALEVNQYGDVFVVYTAKDASKTEELVSVPEGKKTTYTKMEPVDPIVKIEDDQKGAYVMGSSIMMHQSADGYITQLEKQQLYTPQCIREDGVGGSAFPRKFTLYLRSGKPLTLTVSAPTCKQLPKLTNGLFHNGVFYSKEFEFSRLWSQAMAHVDETASPTQLEKSIPLLRSLIQEEDRLSAEASGETNRSDGTKRVLAACLRKLGRTEEAKTLEAQFTKAH
jgi:hypothetical protein